MAFYKTQREYLRGILDFTSKIGREAESADPESEKAKAKRDTALAAYAQVRRSADLKKSRLPAGKLPLEDAISKAKLNDMEIQLLYVVLSFDIYDQGSHYNLGRIITNVAWLNKLERPHVIDLLRTDAKLLKAKVFTNTSHVKNALIPQAVALHPNFYAKAVGEAKKTAAKETPAAPITAAKIYEGLSEYVISQEPAKKRLAAAAYRHLSACNLNTARPKGEKIQKANVLIIGPTGTGKTHLCRTLSGILKVPFNACDATQYTETGYVGMNVEEMLTGLFDGKGPYAERADSGIVYIDEIDKIAASDSSSGHNSTRDVSGLSVQQELLKLLEGEDIKYQQRSGFNYTDRAFNIENVLFIAGGAFQGLDAIVAERLKNKAPIGFKSGTTGGTTSRETLLRQITAEDLISYGFLPEFIGRFPNILVLDPLTLADLEDILTKPRNNMAGQYRDLLAGAGVKYELGPKEISEVAAAAYELKTGARALRAILEARVAPLFFEEPKKSA